VAIDQSLAEPRPAPIAPTSPPTYAWPGSHAWIPWGPARHGPVLG